MTSVLSEIADRAAALEDYKGIISSMLRTVDLVVDKPPNVDWIVNLIGFLDPEHEIFRKDYQPPAKIIAQRASLEYKFDNSDGFFNDLPDFPLTK